MTKTYPVRRYFFTSQSR